jgi:hypothetical protein
MKNERKEQGEDVRPRRTKGIGIISRRRRKKI